MDQRITLKVPYDKKSEFTTRFFYTISDAIDFLGYTYGKAPTSITFQGKIGKEIFDMISNMTWDISKFNPKLISDTSIYSKISISYIDRIKVENDNGSIRGDNLNGKIINGIPGHSTISKITSYSLNYNSTVEKWLKPCYDIILKREI